MQGNQVSALGSGQLIERKAFCPLSRLVGAAPRAARALWHRRRATPALPAVLDAISQRFADEGAKLLLFDLDGDGARAVADSLTSAGARATARAVDITDHAAVSHSDAIRVAMAFGSELACVPWGAR